MQMPKAANLPKRPLPAAGDEAEDEGDEDEDEGEAEDDDEFAQVGSNIKAGHCLPQLATADA
jgi:hypothetical protein